ncbi:uncharacterized protein LOC108091928 isoform X2 [Drosophila ficusphila]|nr:uncharacterized protein LOC108091928 isoform X2 [Drosophila ficusphila]
MGITVHIAVANHNWNWNRNWDSYSMRLTNGSHWGNHHLGSSNHHGGGWTSHIGTSSQSESTVRCSHWNWKRHNGLGHWCMSVGKNRNGSSRVNFHLGFLLNGQNAGSLCQDDNGAEENNEAGCHFAMVCWDYCLENN